MNSTVLAAAVAAVFGIVGGMVSAWFVHWLRRDENRANLDKTKQEIEKTKQDMQQTALNMEQTRLEIEQMRGNVQAAVSYQRAESAVVTLYDSRQGFSGFDFVMHPWSGAEGRIALIDGDVRSGTVSLERSNRDGGVRLELKSYMFRGSSVTVLPAAGATRRLRAELEVRALGADRTIRLVMKDPKSGAGVHLADWSAKLVADAPWTPIDAYFVFPGNTEALFRIDDQSVAGAPSTLQIRKLVLTQRTD